MYVIPQFYVLYRSQIQDDEMYNLLIIIASIWSMHYVGPACFGILGKKTNFKLFIIRIAKINQITDLFQGHRP